MNRALPVETAYALWAEVYDQENPISHLDELAVKALSPNPQEWRFLDVGCGTARRLPQSGPFVVGIDRVAAMLRIGKEKHPDFRLAQGCATRLPFADACFELIWCRLMVGHLPKLDSLYRELSRVLISGGHLILTDFHPEATGRGLARKFKDKDGKVHEVVHYLHTVDEHREKSKESGLFLEQKLDLAIGPEVYSYFQQQGREQAYRESAGTRVLLALQFRKA
ncbi:MAG: class I SAM-dependent methyltransferase [Planctomycetota bacterium]|nr:MAG: class I SAM-dependent methyltransferase [Planctomycetota bacterium]